MTASAWQGERQGEKTLPSIDRRSLQHFDWVLLGLVTLIVAIGITNLYSATASGVDSGLPPEFRRQLMALAVAKS